jgi:hypothetical protein
VSRQTVFVLLLSLFLLGGVVFFSFFFLIPKGKEYRTLRLESKKEFQQLDLAQNRHDNTLERLKNLQHHNAHIIGAFDTPFDPKKFEGLYKKEFTDLYLSEVVAYESNDTFKTYEVNATSKITSPQSFYTFLEQVNKSEWVIEVNFPIHFERDGDKIRSSFTMKVHNKPAEKEGREKKKKSLQEEDYPFKSKDKETAPKLEANASSKH